MKICDEIYILKLTGVPNRKAEEKCTSLSLCGYVFVCVCVCACVCACACLAVVSAAEIVGPRNIAVVRGSAATFSCIIDAPESEVCWTHESVSKTHKNVYNHGELASLCNDNKCTVTFDNETIGYTLTINSVQHYDAGFYDCRICREASEQAAQLIVLQTYGE